LFVVLLMMLHPTQDLEPPANPERFISPGSQPVTPQSSSPRTQGEGERGGIKLAAFAEADELGV